MVGPLYKKLCAPKNLALAFTRLQTAQNLEYKSYYRRAFNAYTLAQGENIEALSMRVAGAAFKPSSILRFNMPQPSGLHRPITLLHLDDMIVYQALANLIGERIREARKPLENTFVFSNLLEPDPTSIYAFQRWQTGY